MPVPQPPSLITGPGGAAFAVDTPVIQDATYAFTNVDRTYLDSQIRGCELHLVQSLVGGIVCTWAVLDSGSGAGAVGSVVCLAGTAAGTVTLATAGALAAAGGAFGILMTAAPPGALVRIARSGLLPPSITGLPTGGASLYAKVNTSTSTVTTAAALSPTDYPLGTVDAAGNLTLQPTSATSFNGVLTVPFRANSAGTLSTAFTLVYSDTSGGAFTLTFPSGMTSANDGLLIRIKDAKGTWATNNLTVSGNTGQKVENPALLGNYSASGGSQVLSLKGESVDFQWDNVQGIWLVV